MFRSRSPQQPEQVRAHPQPSSGDGPAVTAVHDLDTIRDELGEGGTRCARAPLEHNSQAVAAWNSDGRVHGVGEHQGAHSQQLEWAVELARAAPTRRTLAYRR